MGRMIALRRIALLGLAAVVACGGFVGADGAVAGASSDKPEPPARLLLLSVPGLTWTDLQEHDLPAIESLLADAALADLAPRGVDATSTPGAAYLTISAGSRAIGEPLVDGQQLALADQSAGSTARDIFHRRTGTEPDGEYVSLAWPTLERLNKSQPYDAVLGLLATTLEDKGLGAEGIGNADGTDTMTPSFERQVGLAVVDEVGVIPAGEFDSDLLVDDPAAPFGKRLDADQVVDRFKDAWEAPDHHQRGLVVVEASDLARTMRYRDRVDSTRYAQLWSDALRSTDELIADLLAEVDTSRDAVLLAAPYNLPGDRDLTVVGLRAPHQESGYLRSASTQRSGFLTLVDIAPTILDQLDVSRPAKMEGRPAEVVPSGSDLPARVDRLVTLNAASRFRERMLFPTTLAVVLLLAVVCGLAAVLIARGSSERARGVVRLLALIDLAALPMSYLARMFPLEERGAGFYWAFVVLGAIVAAVAATGVANRLGKTRMAVIAVLILMLGVLLGDVMTGSRLSLSAAFGYSPTGNSRLYGISNYSFGQVAAASCLLAAMVAAKGGRYRLAAVGLLTGVLVVIGAPLWGSDVGGILAFTPTILVFALLVWERQIRLRHVVVALVTTGVAVGAFGLLDLARPAEERGHLGRLFERVGNEGLEPLTSIMRRKLLANIGVSTTSFWVAAIPIAVAFLVFLWRYPSHPLGWVRAQIPTLRAGLIAVAIAAMLGSMVNDSGAIVGGVTLMVVAASLVFLTLEPGIAPPPPTVVDNGAEPDSDVEPVGVGL
ncbi:MAG TPA: hypothetical protein VGJ86_00725 [Acidimicrobiales bacterium]